MKPFITKALCIAVIAVGSMFAPSAVHAGDIAIKSNALYDVTGTINLGVEMPVAPQWTVDVSMDLNAWKYGEKSLRHTFIQPEGRYWPGLRNVGHFFAANAIVGYYDAGNFKTGMKYSGSGKGNLDRYTYRGWAYGVGVGYGYAFTITPNWNFELELALGYMYLDYKRFKGGEFRGNSSKNYFGPVKAAATFSYYF